MISSYTDYSVLNKTEVCCVNLKLEILQYHLLVLFQLSS